MDIYETSLLEELMDGKSDQRADTEYCLESICPGTQMGNGPQIFHAVTFFLQRIVCGRISLHSYLLCLDLKRLFCIRSGHQFTLYDNSRPYV